MSRAKTMAGAMLLALCGLSVATAFGGEPSRALFGRALEAASRSESVVVVSTRPAACADRPRFPGEPECFYNTGFFVGTRGEVVTSLLAVAGCQQVTVTCRDGREAAASVVAFDQGGGFALLKAELEDTSPVEFRREPVGEGSLLMLVTARVGSKGMGVLVQPGLVLPRRASIRLNGIERSDLLLTAMYVEQGAAAAPLMDADGRLVGVVVGVRSSQGHLPSTCLCYALPAERLEHAVQAMREGRSQRLGWLGVAIAEEPAGHEGIRVGAVLQDSPAARARIRPGDVILQVGQQSIETPMAFANLVATATPGETLAVKVLQDEIVTVQVEVGARPMLICGASRRPGETGFTVLPPGPPAPPELVEELLRLRRHIRELEARLGPTSGSR